MNVIAELAERGVRCECQKPGCSCTSDADLILPDGARVCGCCLVDCPDVHRDTDPADSSALDLLAALCQLLPESRFDPLAVLPIHTQVVLDDLEHADAGYYRSAARRLARMRKLASGSPEADEVDELIADLRETHRRRPRLQLEFDRAGLAVAGSPLVSRLGEFGAARSRPQPWR